MSIELNLEGKSFRTDEEIRRLHTLLGLYLEMPSDAVLEKPARSSLARIPIAATTAAEHEKTTAPANDKDMWHRDASRRIGRPATFREILREIEAAGITPSGADPRDALSRRIRADAEMMRVGENERVGKGAAESLWILRDLHDSSQTQDTTHNNGLAFDLEPTPSDSMA